MIWFYNLKISQKLSIAFTAVIIILTYIGYDGIVKMRDAVRSSKSLYENRMVPVGMFLEISNNTAEQRALTVNALTAASEKTRESKKIAAELTQRSNDIWKQYMAASLTEEEKALAKKYEETIAAYRENISKVFELIGADKYSDAEVLANKELDALLNESKKSLDALVKLQSEEAKKLNKNIEENAASSMWSSIIAIAIGILVSLGAVILLIRAVAAPIKKAADMLKDIAQGEGDLTKRLNLTTKDEVGELGKWFDTFVEKIHDIVVQISKTASNMASASEELSASATQIAKGTTSQTERATTVAASSEEMSATVMEVAKNTSGASESAKDANKLAQKGKDMVERTVHGMNDIAGAVKESASVITKLGTRSNEIGEIIKVIDDIADQTNLLALNAAIEAARAGEHGRGFAVVADEVRKLAEKTTKATKEIGGMISTIQDETGKAVSSMGAVQKEVEEEVKLAKDAGSSLNEIVSNVDKLTGQIQQIAVASEEQSAATDTISRDIQDIANTTKETATSSNQIASASNNLSKLATELQGIVGKFKV
ncbi:MAG: methyl-accepting chemotaxis protein [Nitrospinae bacterium]|nr:methyl-accepting chemotaxis protein [Nitrospinota bacterium]